MMTLAHTSVAPTPRSPSSRMRRGLSQSGDDAYDEALRVLGIPRSQLTPPAQPTPPTQPERCGGWRERLSRPATRIELGLAAVGLLAWWRVLWLAAA